LEAVLVWPGSAQANGWINLHVNAKNEPKAGEPIKNGGKPWVVGWPFKTADEVVNRISWLESATDLFNVWVCMSQQTDMQETTVNGKIKRRAVRKAANATWLKAIWIDCDVKPGDAKHYHTMTDAFDALDAFRDMVGPELPIQRVRRSPLRTPTLSAVVSAANRLVKFRPAKGRPLRSRRTEKMAPCAFR
jgi:hypothetical protein